MLSAQQPKQPWHTVLSVPPDLTGTEPCHFFSSFAQSDTTHQTLPLQSQEGARSKPKAVGALGICCDWRRKKHGFGAESDPAPVNRSSAVPFSWAGVTACKFAQAADSLVIRTSTYHSEVCKIRQEMPAFFPLLFSSPNYSFINVFYCKYLVFSKLNDSMTLTFTATFFFILVFQIIQLHFIYTYIYIWMYFRHDICMY